MTSEQYVVLVRHAIEVRGNGWALLRVRRAPITVALPARDGGQR